MHYKEDIEVLPSGNIVLRNIQVDESGDYKCIIYNPSTEQLKKSDFIVTLNVSPSTDPPLPTWILDSDANSQIKLNIGDDAVLECPSAGLPEPKVNWTKYDGYLKKSRSQVISGNLHINNLELRDEGTYLCSSNGIQRFVTLEVRELPKITVSSNHIEGELGSSLRIICNVQGRPKPTVQWYHNGKLLTDSYTKILHGDTAKLITKLEESDVGIYQCMASNEAGVASASIYLWVKGQVLDPFGADGEGLSIMNTNSPNETTSIDEDDIKKSRKDKKRNRKKDKRRKKKGKNRRRHRNRVILVPPSQPTVTQLSDSSVMLNWTVQKNEGLAVKFFRVQYKEVAPSKSSWKTEDHELSKHVRQYEVKHLKKGGYYKFRIAAVYTNDDNKVGNLSPRFQLKYNSDGKSVPASEPIIVEVKPIANNNIYGISLKWMYNGPDARDLKGFIVHFKPYDESGDFKEIVLNQIGLRHYFLVNLTSHTDYAIKLQSFNSNGRSQFSKIVVKRTRGPPIVEKTTSGPAQSVPIDHGNPMTSSSGQELYMILGIVLGIMLLALIVFMLMCWWKQRQQRRMPVMNGVLHSKFHDQSHRIYTDSTRKKYMNGGYPTNGYIPNGHGPHSPNKMNINVNPVPPHPEAMSLTRHTDKGTYYHNHIGNGSVRAFGHVNTSDNNFNNINSNKKVMLSNEEASQPMLCDNNKSDHTGDNNEAIVYNYDCCSNHHYDQTLPEHTYDSDTVYSGGDTCDRNSPMPSSVLPGYGLCNQSHERISHRLSQNLDLNQSHDSLSHKHSGHSKQRHRGKHRHNGENLTRDQATNTDLSSNEGTIEFTTFNKSQNSSDQNHQGNPSTDLISSEDLSQRNEVKQKY
ncbi:hypothetical protein LOTGIDRAFT_230536 [Lottia gigantea]|uniref:Interference hedgehog n=1 Tax=Lottia gigantea TaxID=225164 RepID=V4B8D4_LOTGI|nr:hypothetical protein LOTGIDRAFT_230536 [Lottia gigantea]ESP01992.1 hypothetical protein LOTGIDRAFT_230536 [Lottia gigantea]